MKLERLAALVETVSGIVFPAGQLVYLHELMARRAGQLGMTDLPAYVLALEQGRLEDEWRILLPAITVKESYLFRIPEQFRALQERLLPELMKARDGVPLRVWSAGCAHGEEPATLAVMLAEAGLPPEAWSILATDVDERALQLAANGIFPSRAVSQVPPAQLARYFTARAGGWALEPALLARIRFERLNLVREPFPDLGPPFDLIFLRNVLIYFRPDSQRRVVDAVARNLAADGFLFLGHSESLWQLSACLGPIDLGDCFVYRHTPEVAPAATVAVAAVVAVAPARGPGARAGARSPLAHLAGRPQRPRPAAVLPVARAAPALGAPHLAAAVAALAASRSAEALELAMARLTAVPADAGAHALLGWIKDLAGDAEGALAAYRAALFLRPQLFRVRFQLAERLRLAGWRDRARAEYRGVLAAIAAGGEELAELAPVLPGDAAEVATRCRAVLAKL